MRFKIDENLTVEAAESLRQAGHDATTVPQQGLSGAPFRTPDKPHVLDVLNRLLPLFDSDPLTRHLWIVEEDRVRIRS